MRAAKLYWWGGVLFLFCLEKSVAFSLCGPLIGSSAHSPLHVKIPTDSGVTFRRYLGHQLVFPPHHFPDFVKLNLSGAYRGQIRDLSELGNRQMQDLEVEGLLGTAEKYAELFKGLYRERKQRHEQSERRVRHLFGKAVVAHQVRFLREWLLASDERVPSLNYLSGNWAAQLVAEKKRWKVTCEQKNTTLITAILELNRMLKLLSHFSDDDVFVTRRMIELADAQVSLVQEFSIVEGIAFEEHYLPSGVVKYKSLKLLAIGPNRVNRLVRTLQLEYGEDFEFWYRPHHTFQEGYSASHFERAINVSVELITGMGKFDPDTWHEIRHEALFDMERKGLPSLFMGEVWPITGLDLTEILPFNFSRGYSLSELSTFSLSLQSKLKMLKQTENPDKFVNIFRAQEIQSEAQNAANIASAFMESAGNWLLAIERVLQGLIRNDKSLLMGQFPIVIQRGELSTTQNVFGLRFPADDAAKIQGFYVVPPEPSKGTPHKIVIGLISDGLIFTLPLFEREDIANALTFLRMETLTPEALEEASGNGFLQSWENAAFSLFERCFQEVGSRGELAKIMEAQFGRVDDAARAFLARPSENISSLVEVLEDFKPHPIRKMDFNQAPPPPKIQRPGSGAIE